MDKENTRQLTAEELTETKLATTFDAWPDTEGEGGFMIVTTDAPAARVIAEGERAKACRIMADLGAICFNADMGYDPSAGTFLELEWARLGSKMTDLGHDVMVLQDGLVIDGVSARLDGDRLTLHYTVPMPMY